MAFGSIPAAHVQRNYDAQRGVPEFEEVGASIRCQPFGSSGSNPEPESALHFGDLACQAKKHFALVWAESRKHLTAVFDMRIAQPNRQSPSARGQFDANYAAVAGNAATLDQSLTFKTVERRGPNPLNAFFRTES